MKTSWSYSVVIEKSWIWCKAYDLEDRVSSYLNYVSEKRLTETKSCIWDKTQIFRSYWEIADQICEIFEN